jgi:hypothetical protein
MIDTEWGSVMPGLVDTKAVQFRPLAEINSVDGPGIFSNNLTATRKHRILSALPESQNKDTVLSSSTTIGVIHPISENDLPSLGKENSKSLGLLANDPNLLLADSQLGSTMESLKDSPNSDLLSISDSSEHIEPLDCGEEHYPIHGTLLHRLLSEFRSTIQYQLSPGESRGNSGALASTTESSHTGDISGNGQKRNLEQEKDGDNSEDGFLPPPPRKIQLIQGKKLHKLFACPYLKWDLTKYSRCCERKLTRIRDVKQHLSRQHTPERYCQICQASNFPDDRSLRTHIDIENCSRRDPTFLNGISYQQHRQLSRKSKPNTGEEDQWYAIWEILFPGHRRPSSVYMDTHLTLEMPQFREYCYSRGPAILREHIESDPAWLRPETT